MDFSTMSRNSFGGSSLFANSTASTGSPDRNKEKRFYDWHSKQGLSTPQDYSMYASHPDPISSVHQNPLQPTAATPYLSKLAQAATLSASMGGDSYGMDMPAEGRRKSALKKTASSSPPTSPAGLNWPKSMFGSRPPSRTRGRSSATPDDLLHTGEPNLPPLASIYDEMKFDTSPVEPTPAEAAWTPTQVRVANFSEERFPELIQALRTYYGPILESYSGLSDAESKFPDPDVIPREKLDASILRMVQPASGSEGGPGPWVRITFRDHEAAERAVVGSERGELEVGARVIRIEFWNDESVRDVLPFTIAAPLPQQMDIDAGPSSAATTPRRNSTPIVRPTPMQHRRLATAADGAMDTGGDGEYSNFLPGAKLVVPKPVEFAKKEGWLSGWTSTVAAAPMAVAPGASKSWAQSIGGLYSYIMDDLIGFKYL